MNFEELLGEITASEAAEAKRKRQARIVHVRGSFFCGYGDEIDPIHEEGEEHETN